jgi:hypothetical protein
MKTILLFLSFSFTTLIINAQSTKTDNTPKLQNSELSLKNNLKSSNSSESTAPALLESNSINNKSNTQNKPALLNYNINKSDTTINNDSLKVKTKPLN